LKFSDKVIAEEKAAVQLFDGKAAFPLQGKCVCKREKHNMKER
jgi:hypothetical protein